MPRQQRHRPCTSAGTAHARTAAVLETLVPVAPVVTVAAPVMARVAVAVASVVVAVSPVAVPMVVVAASPVAVVPVPVVPAAFGVGVVSSERLGKVRLGSVRVRSP